MATTTTTISRSNLVEPDENHDGGALLHSRVSAMRILLGDHSASRYFEFTGIADSATVEAPHNMGANLEFMTFLIYTGSGVTKVWVPDFVDAGWVVGEKVGNEKTIIEITAPGSGGPHTFVVVMVDGNTPQFQMHQKIATILSASSAETVRTWWDDDGRGLVINQAGEVAPTQSLRQKHVSTSFSAVVGIHYLVDTSGGTVTATLPATIEDYDAIQFSDAQKTFNTNNFTIARNGNSIDSAAADLVLSTPGDGALLAGDNAQSNWIRASAGGAGGTGTGEGDINYVTNGSGENDLNDVTATTVTLAAETGSPLVGDQSFKLTSLASLGTVDWALDTIDNFVIDGNIMLELKAYLDDSGVAGTDGDWKIGVYNVTDALYEVETDIVTSDLNIVQGLIFPPVTGKTYVVRVERTVSSPAGDDLVIDRLVLTPDGNGAIPEAGDTTFGLNKKPRYSTTSLTADATATGQVAELDFTVVTTKTYQITYVLSIQVNGAASGVTCQLRDGTTVKRESRIFTQGSPERLQLVVSDIFTPASTTLNLYVSAVSGGSLVEADIGTGAGLASYGILKELNDHEAI